MKEISRNIRAKIDSDIRKDTDQGCPCLSPSSYSAQSKKVSKILGIVAPSCD